MEEKASAPHSMQRASKLMAYFSSLLSPHRRPCLPMLASSFAYRWLEQPKGRRLSFVDGAIDFVDDATESMVVFIPGHFLGAFIYAGGRGRRWAVPYSRCNWGVWWLQWRRREEEMSRAGEEKRESSAKTWGRSNLC